MAEKASAVALSKPWGAGLMPARSTFTQNGIKLAVAQTIMPFCRLARRPFTIRLRFCVRLTAVTWQRR
jgi:hypothetical protein